MTRQGIFFLVGVTVVCAAMVLFVPRRAPPRCVGPVESLFGHCTR